MKEVNIYSLLHLLDNKKNADPRVLAKTGNQKITNNMLNFQIRNECNNKASIGALKLQEKSSSEMYFIILLSALCSHLVQPHSVPCNILAGMTDDKPQQRMRM